LITGRPEPTSDDDAPDRAGAFADHEDLGIAKAAGDRVLFDEATAAEHLGGDAPGRQAASVEYSLTMAAAHVNGRLRSFNHAAL
jgi:hypothetical protein